MKLKSFVVLKAKGTRLLKDVNNILGIVVSFSPNGWIYDTFNIEYLEELLKLFPLVDIWWSGMHIDIKCDGHSGLVLYTPPIVFITSHIVSALYCPCYKSYCLCTLYNHAIVCLVFYKCSDSTVYVSSLAVFYILLLSFAISKRIFSKKNITYIHTYIYIYIYMYMYIHTYIYNYVYVYNQYIKFLLLMYMAVDFWRFAFKHLRTSTFTFCYFVWWLVRADVDFGWCCSFDKSFQPLSVIKATSFC